jgi:GWxTD domain-containing protein
MTAGRARSAREPQHPSGRRRALVAALGFAACGVGAAGTPVLASPERPITSRGDIRFSVDTASFAPGSGVAGTRQEIYLQIPSTEMRFQKRDGGLRARIELEIAFIDTAGATVAERKGMTELPVATEAQASDPAEMHVLQSDFVVPPGPYRVEVRVRDQARRRSHAVPILLFLRRKASGHAEFDLMVPALDRPGLRVSDLQFAREIVADESESPFRKGALSVVPCPDRVYGLLLPELDLYFEISSLDEESIAEDRVELAYEIMSTTGESVAQRREDLVLHGSGPWPRWTAFDLSALPSGRYGVRVAAVRRATEERATSGGTIEVVWSAFSWNRKLDDLVDELTPVASSDDISRLKRLSSGEREPFLAKFWKELDPTPDTPRNEAFEEHYQRIRIADRLYTSRLRGISTDRGRVYVRFGQPDEISTGFATEEFIGGYLYQPKDEFNFEEEGRARGGYNYKDKPYEVWTYDQRGDQLRPTAQLGSGLGLRFVFVDASGYGDYVLIHSAEGVEY